MCEELELSEEEIELRKEEIHKQVVAQGLTECFTYRYENFQRCKECDFRQQCEMGCKLHKMVAEREEEVHRRAEERGLTECFAHQYGSLQKCEKCDLKQQCSVRYDLNEMKEQKEWEDWVMAQFDEAMKPLMSIACAMRYDKPSEDLSQEEWDLLFNQTYDTLSNLLDFYLEVKPTQQKKE